MAFEDFLPEVGEKGRSQILWVFSFAIPIIFISSHFLLENFTAFVPEHWCWVHFLDNTSALLNVSGNLNFSSLLKLSIPLDSNGKPERCHQFFWPQWQPLGPNVTGQNMSQLEMEPCVDGWVYDQGIFTSSIVTEWDLVCDSQTLKYLSQSILLAGNLVEYLIWGYLSDRMLLPSYLMMAVSSTGNTFVQSFPVYCCFLFLFGSSIPGVTLGSLTLIQEWTNSQHRPLVTVIFTLYFSLGHLFLRLVAYGIQEWRELQLVMSVPFFAFFLASWWLPEFAGWLIFQNRYDEVLKVLTKVAKINGVKETTLTIEVRGEGGAMAGIWEMVAFQAKPSSQGPTKRKVPSLMIFTTSLIFYGLSLDLHNLGSNIQTLQVLLGASAFLSRSGALFIMNLCGCRTIAVACLLLAELFIPARAFLPQEILRVVLAMLAISSIVVYLLCSDRGRCKGLNLMVGRIGAVLAPLVNTLKHYLPALPPIIFAAMAITAGLVVFFLPETQNKPTSDTIEDLEYG
uniref:Major facilitator superfamily (MFS) profile domain-containing protein n=1 Tax=Vombatus ursinus TaxID=29139 RepID=A0A4X2K8B7_VOMUR